LAFNKEKVMDAARKFVEKNQLDKAVKEYLRVVQEDPGDVRIWLKIGDIYAKKGAKQEATETYLRVARHYHDQGFLDKAVAVYKQVVKLDPRLVDAHLKLGELYRQLGKLADAMQHFESVAGHFHREGKTREALATVRQLVELDPDNVATRIKLAELYSKEQLVDEAIKEFTAACEHLRRQARQDDFIKVAERLFFHKPDNVPLARELAGLYLRRNDPRRALQKLQVCFKHEPRDVDTLALLAQAFQGLDQKGKTVQVLKELARIHDEARHKDKATEVYRKILQFAPGDPDATAFLGKGKVPAAAPAPAAVAAVVPARGTAAQPSLAATVAAPAPAPVDKSRFRITGDQPAVPSVRMTGAMPLVDAATLASLGLAPAGASTTEQLDDVDAELDGDFSADFDQGDSSYRLSSVEGEQHAEEIAKILAETDVYMKYGLYPKASDHLKRVFALDPDNVEAREKLKDVYLAQGREREAIGELVKLAETTGGVDPERAASFLRDALALDGTHRPALDLARRLRLDVTSTGAGHDPSVVRRGAIAAVDELELDDLDFEDAPAAPSGPRAAVGVERLDSVDNFDPDDIVPRPAAAQARTVAHGSPAPGRPPGPPSGRGGFEDLGGPTRMEPAADFVHEFDARSETRQVAPEQVRALAQLSGEADDLEFEDGALSPPGAGPWTGATAAGPSWADAPSTATNRSLDDAVAAQLDDDALGEDIDHDIAAELSGRVPSFDDMPFDPNEAREFDEAARRARSDHDVPAVVAIRAPLPAAPARVPVNPLAPTAQPRPAAALVPDPVRTSVDDAVRNEPAVIAAGAPAIEDELDEVDFYLSQNMPSDAVDILRGLAERYPNHPLVRLKLADAEAQLSGRALSIAEVESDAIEGEEDMVDATSGGTQAISLDEIEEVGEDDLEPVNEDDLAMSTDDVGAEVDGDDEVVPLAAASRRAPSVMLERPVDDGDADTHYDLGLAYKEMGLYDEAIKEFGHVVDSEAREVQSRLMMGLCHREQGNFSEAVHHFKQGLHAPQVTERERQSLYYEIGVSYEGLRDFGEALYYLEMVVKRDPGFVDAAERVGRLRGAAAQPAVPDDEASFDGLMSDDRTH
jgi:pilus assembly protein FimV